MTCFMHAGTVDDAYDRWIIFLNIGAKVEVLAVRMGRAVDRSWTSLSCYFE